MSGYVLTTTAQEDLTEIRDYYLEEAGYRVARQMLIEFVEAFRLLARTPGAGHSREDLTGDRPILFWPMRDYVILYKPVSTLSKSSRLQEPAKTYRESLAGGGCDVPWSLVSLAESVQHGE